MRKMFEQFEKLSAQTQELLEKGIARIKAGFAPDPRLCQEITSALSSLHATYDDIRRLLPKHILEEEMPEGEQSVQEYERIWNNSVVSKRNAVCQVLEEFIRVYSDEQKYMDAIQPHVSNAEMLLEEIKENDNKAQYPDITIYQLFLEGMKSDLDENEELYEELLDAFVGRIVNGLKRGKYCIEDNTDAETADHLNGEDTMPLDDDHDRNGDVSEVSEDKSSESQVSETVQKTGEKVEILIPEQSMTKYVSIGNNKLSSKGDEKVDGAVDVIEAFIHPRTEIRDVKLPSEQKLKELISNSRYVLDFLLDKLCCLGLIDEARVIDYAKDHPRHPLTENACQNTLSYLERKGYLSIYQYEGRNILCFNTLMRDCTKKYSLNNMLKRLLNLKKIGNVYMCSKQNMPLTEFKEHLGLVDYYHYVVDKLNKDKESLDILQMCSWSVEANAFFLHLERRDKSSLPLMLVQPDKLPTIELLTDKGIITYSETLPEMNIEDDARYCLTLDGLYNWDSSKWVAITHVDKTSTPINPSEPDKEDTPVEETAYKIVENNGSMENVIQDAAISTVEDLEALKCNKKQNIEDLVSAEKAVNMDSIETAEASLVSGDNSQHFTKIYEEDLSTYEIVEGMTPQMIAEKILKHGITPDHVSVYIYLVESLIEEGTIVYDKSAVHDNMAQAIILLKSLMSFDQVYSDKLERLVYAIDSDLQVHHYTGRDILTVFESESAFLQEHPVEKLMTVIRALLSPDIAHDYDLNSYADSLFDNYEHVFPGLDIIKPIYNLLLTVKKYSSNGFSLQILRKTDNKQVEKQMQSVVVSKARELLTVPTAGNGFIAMPRIMARCFGPESTLGTCLNYIAYDKRDERELVEMAFCEEFGEKVDQSYELSDVKIKKFVEKCWTSVLSQYKKVQDPNVSQNKKIYTNIRERLDVIRQWLDLTDETDTDKNSLGQLVALKKEILLAIDQASSNIEHCNRYEQTVIQVSLKKIKRRLMNAQITNDNEFVDFLRTGYVMLSGNGMPVLDDTDMLTDPFPAWRSVLHHICAPVISLDDTLKEISNKGSIPLFDNIGQAVRICNYVGNDSSPYLEDLANAKASAYKAVDTFKGELELAFAYGRLSEDEKEDILEELQFRTEAFFKHEYFGTLRFYLNALRNVIVSAASAREELLIQDIQQRLKADTPQQLKELLEKAKEKVKAPLQNFVVAEEYINRFDAGTTEELDLRDIESRNTFAEFINDQTFTPLYELCKTNSSKALSGFGVDYVLSELRKHNVSQQYQNSSMALIKAFPNRPDTISDQSIIRLLNELGFEATGGRKASVKSKSANVVRFKISVKPDSKEKAEYSHPVDIMGTNLQSPIDVICLFGRLQPNSIVNTVCDLELGHTAIVLLNGPVDMKARRQIAEIFHGEKSGQNPFILIDWILMLHLAMRQKTERLATLLSCSLPYTSSFQPFVAKGSVPDEMFIGRKKELRQILDPNGVSIVYGGRQLGKTALLERAQSLATKVGRSEYAILLRAADYSIDVNVTEESFVAAIVQKLREVGLSLRSGISSAKQLYDELLKMHNRGIWHKLLLLVDEADNMLRSFKELKPTYKPIISLSDLSRATHGNFKFVLAGLHNVCRAANDPNTVFGQLGSPMCIKPLSSADALELLSRPLSYLGFNVAPEHLEHILVNTSFYPGIVHYVGYSLVENLTTRYSDYYQASNNNPPYDLTDRQLGEIMSSGELNKKIDERINWTLDADPRYLMLACCIAYLYINEPEHNKNGHTVDMIMLSADMFEIASITELQQHEVIGLLEEMVEMGILVKPTGDTFRFRQRRFLDTIGTSDDKIQAKIQNRMRG